MSLIGFCWTFVTQLVALFGASYGTFISPLVWLQWIRTCMEDIITLSPWWEHRYCDTILLPRDVFLRSEQNKLRTIIHNGWLIRTHMSSMSCLCPFWQRLYPRELIFQWGWVSHTCKCVLCGGDWFISWILWERVCDSTAPHCEMTICELDPWELSPILCPTSVLCRREISFYR